MNERGLWELFYRTGLPEAWLVLAAGRRNTFPGTEQEEPAKTAFQARTGEV